MYRSRPNLYIGFHGCEKSVRDNLVNNPNLVIPSQENFDWLGHGFYVWENNSERALLWAKDKQKRGKLEKPSVLGVVYQLDYCLDFTDSEFIKLIGNYYELMQSDFLSSDKTLPMNKDIPNNEDKDLVLRELDCAVIEYMHTKIDEQISEDIAAKGFTNLSSFDTVRGIFTEGGPAFAGAGIQKKNHIQICIRNLNCIKGFFIPRKRK